MACDAKRRQPVRPRDGWAPTANRSTELRKTILTTGKTFNQVVTRFQVLIGQMSKTSSRMHLLQTIHSMSFEALNVTLMRPFPLASMMTGHHQEMENPLTSIASKWKGLVIKSN